MNIRILCAVFEGLEGGFGCDGESSWCDFAHFSDLGLNPLPARPLVVRNGSRRRGELRKVWVWLFL